MPFRSKDGRFSRGVILTPLDLENLLTKRSVGRGRTPCWFPPPTGQRPIGSQRNPWRIPPDRILGARKYYSSEDRPTVKKLLWIFTFGEVPHRLTHTCHGGSLCHNPKHLEPQDMPDTDSFERFLSYSLARWKEGAIPPRLRFPDEKTAIAWRAQVSSWRRRALDSNSTDPEFEHLRLRIQEEDGAWLLWADVPEVRFADILAEAIGEDSNSPSAKDLIDDFIKESKND